MRIHQITHLFQPDELAGAALYTDLARMLRDRGHDVRVTTTFPYYPALRYRPEDAGVVCREELFENIPVRRLGMFLPRRHRGWRRLLPEISYAWRLARLARFQHWEPDVVITACPMLAQCLAQRWLYRSSGIPRLIVVQDLMTDAALELGILKGPGLGTAMRAVERWALRTAGTLVAISPAMATRMAPLGRRTVVIPNWIHESLRTTVAEIQRTPPPRQNHQLFYSGNLGVKQGLPQFLSQFSAAASEWTLEIHGDGAEAIPIREAAQGRENIRLSGLQEEPEYLRSLAAATACLITQRAGVGANFLPSKLLPALATGTPVLAVCDLASPLGQEVTRGGFGVIVAPGDHDGLRSVLQRWSADSAERSRLSAAATAHARNFSRERALQSYVEELSLLTRR
jgi:colanic acid biosynthesis glycosyl transferase WcaI